MIAAFGNLPPSGQPRYSSEDGSAYSVAWLMYSSLTFICPHFSAFDRTNIPSMHWKAMSILAEEVSSEDGIQCDWFQYSTCDGQIVSPQFQKITPIPCILRNGPEVVSLARSAPSDHWCRPCALKIQLLRSQGKYIGQTKGDVFASRSVGWKWSFVVGCECKI